MMAASKHVKIPRALITDGRLRRVAGAVGKTAHEILGAFVILASHADASGFMSNFAPADVDDVTRIEGLAAAMPPEWLTVRDDGLCLFAAPETARQTSAKRWADVAIPAALDCPRFRSAWSDWSDVRRARRAAMSPAHAQRTLGMLAELPADLAISIVERSADAGWQGLFIRDGVRLSGAEVRKLARQIERDRHAEYERVIDAWDRADHVSPVFMISAAADEQAAIEQLMDDELDRVGRELRHEEIDLIVGIVPYVRKTRGTLPLMNPNQEGSP